MPHLIVGLLLDDGGREWARVLTGLVSLGLLALLLAVAVPAVLLASPGALNRSTALAEPGVRVSVTSGTATSASARAAASTNATVGVAAATSASANATTTINGHPVSLMGSAAVAAARRYLGVPYVFGGTNPAVGLDCSGLVQLVFKQLGVSLPRTAQQQYDATSRLPRDGLRPGDLVFFARTYDDPHDWVTHVGIYLGNGLQINAPTEGQVVSIQPVFSGFWGAHYAGAGFVAAP